MQLHQQPSSRGPRIAVASVVRARRIATAGRVGTGFVAAVVGAALVSVGVTGCGAAGGQHVAVMPSTPGQEAAMAHPLACGRPVAPAVVSEGSHGLHLSIASVTHHTASPIPDVAVALSASEATIVNQPGRTPIQILLLREGMIVDRIGSSAMAAGSSVVDWIADHDQPGASAASGVGAIGFSWAVKPDAPYVVTVTGPGHCASADWADAWANPAQYSLMAVMSVPLPLNEPVPTASGAPADPLLVTDAVPLRAF
jgi:hypothetical protein